MAGAADVVHLDLHTGLGGRGDGRLLIDYTLTGRQRDRLTRWFGAKAFSTPDSSRTAYTARGGLGRWCVSQRPRPAGEYLFAYAEFGTFAGARVLAGLRAENQAHHWGRPLDPGTIRAKAALRELFCPADRAWRSKAIARSLDLISRAADGLAGEGHPG